MRIKRYPRFRYKQTAFRLLCAVICIAICCILLDARLRPSINELAKNRAVALAVTAVNDAVGTVLTDKRISYDDIAEISRDNGGNITSVSTDVVKMNMLKTAVTRQIDKQLNSIGETTVCVPLGSATGVSLFYGSGPNINVKLSLSSSTVTDFENEFKSAGVNQTQHSIMLKISANVIIILPNRSCTQTVNTDFCVAQTIIVGTVPQVMAELS